MPQILLLRHSNSVANAEGLLVGSLSPLHEAGKALARQKGQDLFRKGFTPTEVFASTLLGAEETASSIVNELGIHLPIHKIAELSERNFGDYEGRPLHVLFDAFDTLGPNPPSVETGTDFIDRVMSGFEKVKRLTTVTSLFITHSNVLAVIHWCLFDKNRIDKFWETYESDYWDGFGYSFLLSTSLEILLLQR